MEKHDRPARARALALLELTDELLAELRAAQDLPRLHAAEVKTRACANIALVLARLAPVTDIEEHAAEEGRDDAGPHPHETEAIRIELRQRLAAINAELERRGLARLSSWDRRAKDPGRLPVEDRRRGRTPSP